MISRKTRLSYSSSEEKDEIREMMIASAKYASNTLSALEIGRLVEIPQISLPKQHRTRRRLDNLTPDEKIRRKKLKNREAAQTSRDKKKAYVTNLETAVLNLKNQNENLTSQVATLLSEKEELLRRTERLERDLRLLSEKCSAPTGSAEPTIPLQKDLALLHQTVLPKLPLIIVTCWTWMISIGSTMLQTLPILKNWKKLRNPSLKKQWIWSTMHRHLPRWWGPNQKAWNPIALNQQSTTTMIKVNLWL